MRGSAGRRLCRGMRCVRGAGGRFPADTRVLGGEGDIDDDLAVEMERKLATGFGLLV